MTRMVFPSPIPAPTCPDGGTCHHGCIQDRCYRVRTVGPLSAYGPDWTPQDVTIHTGPLVAPDTLAISLDEPYARAVAIGLKGWETRSWPARATVGQLLVVCATARKPRPSVAVVAGRPLWSVGADGGLRWCDPETGKYAGHAWTKPGMVACVVRVDRMVPIGRYEDVPDRTDAMIAPYPRQGNRLYFWPGNNPTDQLIDIEAQRAWGDWTPGRWAWQLNLVAIPLSDDVPVKGQQRLWKIHSDLADQINRTVAR